MWRYTPTPRQTVSAPAFKLTHTIINNVTGKVPVLCLAITNLTMTIRVIGRVVVVVIVVVIVVIVVSRKIAISQGLGT